MKTIIVFLFCGLLCACGGDEQQRLSIELKQVSLSLKSTGELASDDTITIGPPSVRGSWQHKITYLIPEGTVVKKGQKIIAFDSQKQRERLRKANNELATEKQKLASQQLDSEQDLEQLKLDIAEAKMNLTKAQKKSAQDGDYMARLEVKKLEIDHKISLKAFELSTFKNQNKKQQVTVENEISRAEVERLQAEVKEFQQAIGKMTKMAPKDGIVVYLPNNEDSKPAEGDNIFMAQKVIELPNLNKMIVETTIPEQDVSRVAIGQLVQIKLDALPDRLFNGKIESLGKVVRVKSRLEPSMVFDAVISIDNPDSSVMRPGMSVRLDIIEKQLDKVIELPPESIHYDKDDSFVQIPSLFGSKQVAVKIVGRQNNKVLVTGELKDGDEVLL